jgi:hypothetical protein
MNLYALYVVCMNTLYQSIYMGLYESKQFVRQCAAVQQCERCERQCVAMPAAVCPQSVRQCTVVFLVVYGSAHGSVRLSGSVRQCEAVCGSVRQCAAVYSSVRQCAA